MKNAIIKKIEQENGASNLEETLNIATLFPFAFIQTCCLIRGFKVVFSFRKPKGMTLGKEVSFFNMSKIKWGEYLDLGNNVQVSGLSKNGIHFGNNVSIGSFSRVVVSPLPENIGDKIMIGDNVTIGDFSYLGGTGGLEIGDECKIEHNFNCHPENHNYGDIETVNRYQITPRKGITIGKNCSIGSKVTILEGVNIGYGSVIGAGSVVTKSFSENSIIGGVPAKLLKSRKNNLQNHFNNLLSCKPI